MNILDILKQKGYRLTNARKEILKVINNHPKTAQHIYEELQKKHISVDLASVYRSLELFVDIGVIYMIEFGDDKKRYELVDHTNHHHHLICKNCGDITDIQIAEQSLLKQVTIQSQFKIDHHHLEFFGLCTKCQ